MEFEISKYNPCPEALKFRAKFETFREAWENCPRGDWMLWIASELKIEIKLLTKAKALCANTVRHLMQNKKSIEAIDIALKFSDGKATIKELNDAADAAADAAAYAAYAAADADAAYAADAAADANAAYAAADAADAAAYADATAAAAADAAAYAAYAAADADAAKKGNQQQTANICREILTEEIYKKLNI